MKTPASIFAVLLLACTVVQAEDEWLDRLDQALTINAFDGNLRARLSGTFDLEYYRIQQPSPGLLYTDRENLVNPRLTLFLDTQLGSQLYGFVQARIDRGFDPSDGDGQIRLDEWVLRFTPWDDGRFSLQAGKFATVAGNWVQRHLSWDNPFITAPLPYENLTGIWDGSAPDSAATLLSWSHVPYQDTTTFDNTDKKLRLPVLWGPSYATGISVAGHLGKFEYAAEVKNASLSSRPYYWDPTEMNFDYPTFTTRFGFRPNPTWNFGFSLSTGAYMTREAATSLPADRSIGDYRENVIGQDIGFEWHHLQIWAEFYEARFQVPNVGNADTFAYYIEAKYKITPQLFAALRWNQQLFATIPDGSGERVAWGNDLWRIDAAIGYRFTTYTQLKLQYSLQHERNASREVSHMVAGQFTVKF
jgi:hypothetical protein